MRDAHSSSHAARGLVLIRRSHVLVTSPMLFMVAWLALWSPAAAAIEGDAEPLKLAAAKYRANREQLHTWRGRAVMTTHSIRADSDVKVECSIEFAYDSKRAAWRSIITTDKDVEIVNGQEKPRMPLERRALMFREGAYYEVSWKLQDEQQPHLLSIQPDRFMRPGYHNGTFEPLFFLTYQGDDLDRYWLTVFEAVQRPDARGAITRSGDSVTVTQVSTLPGQNEPPGSLISAIEFDLARAGNATRIETALRGNGTESGDVWTWSWEQVNGVWVPKEAAMHHVRTGGGLEDSDTTFRWTENVVNEPLAEDEFSLAKLGLRRGDGVLDTRTGSHYQIGSEQIPGFPESSSAASRPAPVGQGKP